MVKEFSYQHSPSMTYPMAGSNGMTQVFCLARSRRVVFRMNNRFYSGFHNQSSAGRRCYARRFLCTVVSISSAVAYYTAWFDSFLGRYNHLGSTCQFLQVRIRRWEKGTFLRQITSQV